MVTNVNWVRGRLLQVPWGDCLLVVFRGGENHRVMSGARSRRKLANAGGLYARAEGARWEDAANSRE